jgi:hypothetical protein
MYRAVDLAALSLPSFGRYPYRNSDESRQEPIRLSVASTELGQRPQIVPLAWRRDAPRLGLPIFVPIHDAQTIGTLAPSAREPAPQPAQSTIGTIQVLVRRLLDREQISAARRLLAALPPDQQAIESLRRLRVLLAEPIVTRKPRTRAGGIADLQWIRANGRDYSGRWVALLDGTLVDSDKQLVELVRRTRLAGYESTLFLHKL